MTLPVIRPMLAASSSATGSRRSVDLSTLNNGTHLFDLKLDGLRAILYWDGFTARLVNRSGLDITAKFPDVRPRLPANLPLILDGELVCASGLFTDVATRGKQVKPEGIVDAAERLPARFVAFDVLWMGGDYRDEPYALRRLHLERLLARNDDPSLQPSLVVADGLAMWDHVVAHGLEGLIAKSKTGVYAEGKRSPLWLKYKTVRRLTCLMTGYAPGLGARSHFGAGLLSLVGPAGLVSVGRVGTGFTLEEIDFLKKSLDAGIPVLVEIEALNASAGGQLRFPVYLGQRTDLPVSAASLDQLDQFPRC